MNFDEQALRRAVEMEAAASHALSCAGSSSDLERLERPFYQLLGAAHAGEPQGVWVPALELRELCSHTLSVRPDPASPYSAEDRARIQADWWHIHVTAMLLAHDDDTVMAALAAGVVAVGDVEYWLAGWPRTRGSATGARRREFLRDVKSVATVVDRHAGSYDPHWLGALQRDARSTRDGSATDLSD